MHNKRAQHHGCAAHHGWSLNVRLSTIVPERLYTVFRRQPLASSAGDNHWHRGLQATTTGIVGMIHNRRSRLPPAAPSWRSVLRGTSARQACSAPFFQLQPRDVRNTARWPDAAHMPVPFHGPGDLCHAQFRGTHRSSANELRKPFALCPRTGLTRDAVGCISAAHPSGLHGLAAHPPGLHDSSPDSVAECLLLLYCLPRCLQPSACCITLALTSACFTRLRGRRRHQHASSSTRTPSSRTCRALVRPKGSDGRAKTKALASSSESPRGKHRLLSIVAPQQHL